jgi:hypothetical protein
VLSTVLGAVLKELARLPVKDITRRVRSRARKTITVMKSIALYLFVGFEVSVDILEISFYF